MINDFLLHAFDIARIPYKKDFPLAQKSTFKIGNTADLYTCPDSPQQLKDIAASATAAGEKFFILGGSSNIVFPDQPYHGIIISTENLNNILMTDEQIPEKLPENSILVTCQAGTPMAAFVSFCTKHNLSGCEEFAGLPGTVGGAVYMNARCFEKSINQILYSTSYFSIDENGVTKTFSSKINQDEWAYKKSPFQTGNTKEKKIILEVTFILTKETSMEHQEIENACKNFIAQRVNKGHFRFPSAGSVFKNNHNFGKPSGQLIDECGLKGTQIGGAQIALFHGNFIINIDHASAKNVEDLVKMAQIKVKEKFGFDLEPEIIFLKN